MSSIKITELSPVGSSLFQDSESFLQDLSESATTGIVGGLAVSQVSATAGYEVFGGNYYLANSDGANQRVAPAAFGANNNITVTVKSVVIDDSTSFGLV